MHYVADGAGFRANIATNEPGTALSLPAAATYNTAPALAVAAAPVVTAPAYPASVAPATYVAPVTVAKATSYSTAVQHGAIHAAPVAVAAPAPAVADYAVPAAIAASAEAKIPVPAV